MCLSTSLSFVPQVQSHGSQGSSLFPSLPHTQTYPSISRPSLPSCPPPPPHPSLSSHLDNAALSFLLGGGLPWTNIVPYAGSCGGPYCVWRNGELTPMSEPSQWGHCVWIFLQLTQSHPTSLPCTGQARGYSGCSTIICWKHAHSSKLKFTNKSSLNRPQPFVTRYSLCLINFPPDHTELNMSLLLVLTELWANGCMVIEGGPCNSFFLIEKSKTTHKGLYCISIITGFRMLSDYFKIQSSEEICVNKLISTEICTVLII